MRKAILTASAQAQAQFHDLDPMNVVWHGNYPRFLELGRVALMDRLDYNYAQMEASGYAWPVIDMHIRYAHPVVLHQSIIVTAGLLEWENRLKIAFEISDEETSKRLVKAHTVQVAVDAGSKKMLWETPDVFRKKVEPFLK
ncbi:thioesterase family protein [Henriciella sp.]|uniref:acyl-CoA thioesterase n=1 Tax=Henriciella sp. TaxID=1968823 RepID=UPI00260BB114|nr:thioesterase family protein [Henriciella sp.]